MPLSTPQIMVSSSSENLFIHKSFAAPSTRRSPAVSLDSDHKITVDAKKEREEATMSGWYVSYRAGDATVMSLAKSRDEAISAACGLLDRKIDVQEIGPLLGMRDPGDIIDSVEIRKLHAMRPQPDSAHVGG